MLLEVIFAIALFAAAAGTIIGAFTASLRATRQMRLQTGAVDRAVTLLSEMQMGLVQPIDDGPTDYEEPDQDWSWQVVTSDLDAQSLDAPAMTQVQILITYKPDGYTYSLFHVVPSDGEERESQLAGTEGPEGGGVRW